MQYSMSLGQPPRLAGRHKRSPLEFGLTHTPRCSMVGAAPSRYSVHAHSALQTPHVALHFFSILVHLLLFFGHLDANDVAAA